MIIEDIEVRVLRDVQTYYDLYMYPYLCDQLRRGYHHYTKKFGYEFFNDYLNELKNNGKLFITVTPAGKKVALPYPEGARLDENGSLTEMLAMFDKNTMTRRHRMKKE